jgi:sugar fermentation stimulation protein A
MKENQPSRATCCSLFFENLTPAKLLRRDNRFRVQVQVGAQVAPAHLPNSGRLGELLVPGAKVWLTPASAEARSRRKTDYDLTLVEHAGQFVSVDARLPSSLVATALACGHLPQWRDYPSVQREVAYGSSRLDLRLDGHRSDPPYWIEVKSVTLVKDGTALFPDAPTARGRRHLSELTELVQGGQLAAAVFVVQRSDPLQFSPHPSADPAFAIALQEAVDAGVDVVAYRCRVTRRLIELTDPISVVL